MTAPTISAEDMAAVEVSAHNMAWSAPSLVSFDEMRVGA